MVVLSKKRTHRRIMLYAEIVVMIANRGRQLVKRKQLKRFWRRGIFRDRKLYSEYYTLYQSLRDSDREFYYRYARMSKELFHNLINLVRNEMRIVSDKVSSSHYVYLAKETRKKHKNVIAL